MYKKLIKNFVGKNKGLFFLILLSLSISLSGYIFSDSITKNFLNTIENDARLSLGGDFVIDIGNNSEKVFEDFYNSFPYKDKVELGKEYSINSSIEIGRTFEMANVIFHSENYPFYNELNSVITNTEAQVLVSKDFYNRESKSINLLGKEFEIKGYINSDIGSNFIDFLGSETFLLDIRLLSEIQNDDTNSLIEKKYFLKLNNESDFEKINMYFESVKKQYSFIRFRDYKTGGDRFSDIVSNLRSYINYVILFSFLLTATIIFIAISSFFITEKRSISILKILGLNNKKLWSFILLLFISILLFSLSIGVVSNIIGFNFLQNLEYTKGFTINNISIIYAGLIGLIIILGSSFVPIIKFSFAPVNTGLGEDFFGVFSKKEGYILALLFIVLIVLLSLLLGYKIITSILFGVVIIIFLILFYLIISFLIKISQKLIIKLRKNHFIIYDSIRSAGKPGNMSFLLGISFFIVFSVGLSILLLFGNFNERLKINLDSDKNFFVLNITPETYKKLSSDYKKQSFSLIKGRIIKINNIPIKDHLSGNNSGEFTREFNITDNSLLDLRILEGGSLVEGGVSIDYDFGKRLNIGIGDVVTFSIFGLEKKLEIINIRESQDRSINPFFYFQVDKKEFDNFPKQYFLSSYVLPEDIEKTKKYFYDLSNGSTAFIEVEKILEELKEVSIKALLVIQSLFLYIIIFCILSILVVILFFSLQQKKNNYLYKVLGASVIQNRIKNFTSYFFLATLMFIISILIISPLFYYSLSFNTFINFNWLIYIKSIGTMFLVYLFLLVFIWFGIRE